MKVLQVSSFHAGVQREKEWLTKLEEEMRAIQQAIDGFVALEQTLKGQGGNALRAFYNDCHLPFILYFRGFQVIFQEILSNMKAGLQQLEPSESGYIDQSFLEGEVESGLTEISTITANLTDDTNSIMDTVSDIVGLPHLNDSDVQMEIKNARKKRDTTVTDLVAFDTNQTATLEIAEFGINNLKSWLRDIEFLMAEGLTGVDFPQNEWNQAQSSTPIGKFYKDYEAYVLANNPRVIDNDIDVSSPNKTVSSEDGGFVNDMKAAFLSSVGLSPDDWTGKPLVAAATFMAFSDSGYAAYKEAVLAKKGLRVERTYKMVKEKPRVQILIKNKHLIGAKQSTYTGHNATNYTKLFRRVDVSTNLRESLKFAGNRLGYLGIGLTAAGNIIHGANSGKSGSEITGEVVSDVAVAGASWVAAAAAGAKVGASIGLTTGPLGAIAGAVTGVVVGVTVTTLLNGIKIFDADKDGKKDSVRDIVKTGVSKLVGIFG